MKLETYKSRGWVVPEEWLKKAGYIKNMAAVKRLRDARRAQKPAPMRSLESRLKGRRVLVQLSPVDQHKAESRAKGLRPRLQNWVNAAPSFGMRAYSEESCGRYSYRCTYTRYEYTPHLQSYATVIGRRAHYHYDGKKRVITAPKGYTWKIDGNGLAICKGEDDYHPLSGDLMRGDAVRFITKSLRELAACRREAARKQRYI